MPLASMFGVPFAYALVLLALTLAFDRRAFTNLGLTPRPRFLALALLALLAGLAMFVIRTFALAALYGGTTRVHYTWGMFVFMLSSVITEELIFRGYAFKTLADRNKWLAIALFAVAFGVYHWVQWNLWNHPVAMFFALLSTGSAHVMFALALLKTRTLWVPIALHLGWNVAGQALVLAGVPQDTKAFLTGFAISEALVAIAIAVIVLSPPRARPLPAASP